MQIKQLDIYGYGKWVDQTFDLSTGLHVFLGNNEAGKSTLMSFIHSILFGFPTRSSTLLRYEPLESSKYGGRIIAEDERFGEVIIERVHGKVTGNVTVTLEDGTVGSDELLETILKGMTRETFQNIFSFSLTDIEDVHRLNKNELSRYLLNVGAHSTDHYLNLVDDFQKSAYNLYRPSGRIPELNKELTNIKNQEKKLLELEKKNEGYLELIEKNNQQNEELLAIEAKRERANTRLSDIKELKKDWHLFEEIHELTGEIETIKLPPLKKDGDSLLEDYKNEIAQTNAQLQEIHLAKQAQKETFANPEIIENYEQYKQDIIKLEQNLPEIVEQLSDLQAVENQLDENRIKLQELERSLNIENQTASPVAFSADEAAEIKQWQDSVVDIEKKQVELSSLIQQKENEIQLKNQRADQYEEMMWDPQTFKTIEQQIEEAAHQPKTLQRTEKTGSKWPAVFTSILAVGAFAGAFFTDSTIRLALLAGGVILLLLSFVLLRKTSKKLPVQEQAKATETDAFLVNEYEKQSALKKDYEALLAEIDAVQAVYQDRLKEFNQYSEAISGILTKWQMSLIRHHLPELLPLERAADIISKANQLHQLTIAREELTQKLLMFKKQLEEIIAPIDAILALENSQLSIAERVHQFRRYLKVLNEELGKEEQKLNELNVLQHKAEQLLAHKEGTQSKINHLLEATGVKTEEEFMQLYKEKEKLEAKQSRLNFLKENVTNFNPDKKLPTKEEILRRENKLVERLTQLNEQHKKMMMELTSTQLTIQNLEKDGTYTEALQAFENQKAVVQRLVDEWISDKLAAGIIQHTLNQVTKERFEEIISEVNEYFHLLTDGEYEKIVFIEEELHVQHQDGTVIDVKVLSRGTAEPLYVAIRLAYIINMQDMVKLPIIMDDPFVNFDLERKENMYRLLNRLSPQVQILYFTFDLDVFEHFEDAQMIELNTVG